MPKLTHLDAKGQAKMVDVGHKPATTRVAVAEGFVQMSRLAMQAITENRVAKGEVLGTARIAAILAAKRVSDLIPLCHGLNVDSIQVDFELTNPSQLDQPARLRIESTVRIHARTGVEMEALTAVSIAALTVYDMCKAIDKSMVIDNIHLLKKTGGKSGPYQYLPPPPNPKPH